jgi:glucose/arabinose dehydrogenase
MRRAAALFFTLLAAAAWAEPAPGTRFRMTADMMPPPGATPSVSNSADIVERPRGVAPQVPPGYRASLFADSLGHARNLMVLPDGGVLLAESERGRVTLLRDTAGTGRADSRTVFADGLKYPFGLALDGGAVYVADTQRVWRYPYTPGETKPGPRQGVTADGALGGASGHSTRNIALAPDGSGFFVAIGSADNLDEEAPPRATIQRFAMDGSHQRTFAGGLRNPVGLAFRPGSSELWTVVNERDGLGDELVPDYLTHVAEGGFYGWPYAYIGPHKQPGYGDKAPAKVAATLVPDLLFRAHSAPLGLAFWHGDAFVSLHGSWNRSHPQGYFVARVRFENGRPVGDYEAFVTGFIVYEKDGRARVWGRPVGLAVGPDDALYVADDAGQTVWKIVREK